MILFILNSNVLSVKALSHLQRGLRAVTDGRAFVGSQQLNSCTLFSLVILFSRQGLLLFLWKGEKKAAGESLSDDSILGGY